MRALRTLAFLLCFVCFGAPAQAQSQTQSCFSANTPVVVAYGTGTISISYQVCFTSADFSSFNWTGTVTYNNVNWGGGFSINGAMNLVVNYSANSISSIAFNGGPLNYVIGGQPYVVSFNNLTFNFSPGFQVSGATGTLSINGVPYGGDPVYWGYLFH
jgi:uncharacterized membrane protein